MPLPAGVTTVQLAVLPNPVGVISANIQITPSQNLIWSATGTPLSTCCNTFPMPGWVILPAVDQAGWVTADTRTGVTLWTYLVTAQWTDINGSHTLNGSIQVFLDQTIDYTVGSSSGVLSAAPEYPIGGLALNGWVATYGALPSALGEVNAGEAWINQADDLVYVWSGSAWPVSGHGFSIAGIAGSTGPTGAAGPANSLSIGTVSSGTAAASIGGSPPSQTLNLTLPAGPTGATGVTGPTGSVGPTGTRGSDWFSGSGAPGTIGGALNGDWYFDTSGTGNYYSYNGTIWSLVGSVLGPTGPTGASSTWHVGSGVPSSGLGNNGDMYLNYSTGDIYGPKASGSWGSVVENIVGPGAVSATTSTEGIIQLAGVLAGTATSPAFGSGANATTSAPGIVQLAGILAGTATAPTFSSSAFGTSSTTAAVGNDSRITGAAPAASPTITGTFTLNASALAGSAIATAATASTLAERDSNANLTVNNLVESYNTTVTSSTTQTLTAASAPIQFYTGSTAQPVTLPVASTLTEGWSTLFVNNSTTTVTVSSSGANTVIAIPAGGVVEVVCILNSGTSASSWSALGPFALLASPTFTGTVTIPTPSTADNSTKAASTAYVQSNLSSYLTTSSASSTYAPLASPALTGTPTTTTPSTADNSTKIADTAYVQANLSSYLTSSSASSTYAPLASPALTGTPTVPTAAPGTTNTQIASTAYATTAALAFSLILGV